jgi:hypothetical protein
MEKLPYYAVVPTSCRGLSKAQNTALRRRDSYTQPRGCSIRVSRIEETSSLPLSDSFSRLDDLREFTDKEPIPVYLRQVDKLALAAAFPYIFDPTKVQQDPLQLLSLSLSLVLLLSGT